MALTGQSFSDFPMGSGWEAADQADRDKFIRLAVGRLFRYGITEESELNPSQTAALAAYVKIIFDRDGNNAPEPPAYLINSLGVATKNQPTSFSLDDAVAPSADAPSSGGVDIAAVDARIADWAETDNTDQIPADKLANAPAGAGGGLNEAQVDARVDAGVFSWAHSDDNSSIPLTKLDADELNASAESSARAVVYNWAEEGDDDPIPAYKLVDAPFPPSGLSQAQVDDRVALGVEDWAEAGNASAIPDAKVAGATLNAIHIGVEGWAQAGNSDSIPASKLTNAPSGGGLDATEVDDRIANWAETSNIDVIPDTKIRAGYIRGEALGMITGTVLGWARVGDTGPIPSEKLVLAPSDVTKLDQGEVDASIRAGVEDWAESGNTDPIPAEKLTNAPSGGGGGSLSYTQVGFIAASRIDYIAEGTNDTLVLGIPDSDQSGFYVFYGSKCGNPLVVPIDKIHALTSVPSNRAPKDLISAENCIVWNIGGYANAAEPDYEVVVLARNTSGENDRFVIGYYSEQTPTPSVKDLGSIMGSITVYHIPMTFVPMASPASGGRPG